MPLTTPVATTAVAAAPLTRARRVLLALTAAVALLVAGLAVPARAADPLDITGRVVFPSGYTYDASAPPRFEVRYPTSATTTEAVRYPVLYVTVAADGTFTVPGSRLESTRQYYLLLADGQQRLVAGYVNASGGISPQHPAGALFSPGRTGVVVSTTIGQQVTGRIVLPSGYTADANRPLSLWANVGTPYAGDERWTYGKIASDGSFVVGGFASGQAVRISILDPQEKLYDGAWNPTDGYFSATRLKAGTVNAGASGLTLRPNLAGSISGRVVADAAFLANTSVSLDAVVDTSGIKEGFSYDAADDGTFTIPDLDTGRSYAISMFTFGSLQSGALRADGSWSPVPRDDKGFAATWSSLKKIRPTATGVVLRPTVSEGVHGFVTVPDGFQFDRWDTNAARVQLWRRGTDGVWATNATDVALVEPNGWFSLRAFDEAKRTEDHLLYFEPNASVNAKNARFTAGFWTGSTTALTSDPAKAKVVRHTTGVDVRIPFAVRNLTKPSVTGTVRVGSAVKVAAGTWDPSSVTTSVQWLRDGTAISGATSTTYTPKAADEGTKLSVRVTANGGTGWLATSATSAAVTVAPAPISNVTRVSISGTVGYGKTVWANRGTWSQTPTSTSVQWLRDGVAISGATGSSYKVTKSDVGTQLSVRVTAKAADGSTARSTSVQTKVPKVTPTVKVSVPSVKAGTKLKATVTVDSGGLVTKPLGTVAVTIGSKTIKVTLTATHAGKVTVTLPAQAKGSHKVTATYSPTSTSTTYLTGATSSAVTVKVT
ncbi:Ig-like domain repeat protein [Cellulomonas palmilytica]|uniref:Ig-like domain repeat protein n=1 Tax=Cellulomonas palmilytica TaxID=2608402 RepID=UPI001F2E08E3|nr:Ig-like domain repeat protein [Cellulomonas palmilytica]UJP40832.1 Ig-like domain repeat protein [Cellulomonas palmilytica]